MIKELEELRRKKPEEEIRIDGIGVIRIYGKIDSNKVTERLLKCKWITG
jgi:hypothetical protein